MAKTWKITQVEAVGFPCGNVTKGLGPVNFFTGPNQTGKTLLLMTPLLALKGSGAFGRTEINDRIGPSGEKGFAVKLERDKDSMLISRKFTPGGKTFESITMRPWPGGKPLTTLSDAQRWIDENIVAEMPTIAALADLGETNNTKRRSAVLGLCQTPDGWNQAKVAGRLRTVLDKHEGHSIAPDKLLQDWCAEADLLDNVKGVLANVDILLSKAKKSKQDAVGASRTDISATAKDEGPPVSESMQTLLTRKTGYEAAVRTAQGTINDLAGKIATGEASNTSREKIKAGITTLFKSIGETKALSQQEVLNMLAGLSRLDPDELEAQKVALGKVRALLETEINAQKALLAAKRAGEGAPPVVCPQYGITCTLVGELSRDQVNAKTQVLKQRTAELETSESALSADIETSQRASVLDAILVEFNSLKTIPFVKIETLEGNKSNAETTIKARELDIANTSALIARLNKQTGRSEVVGAADASRVDHEAIIAVCTAIKADLGPKQFQRELTEASLAPVRAIVDKYLKLVYPERSLWVDLERTECPIGWTLEDGTSQAFGAMSGSAREVFALAFAVARVEAISAKLPDRPALNLLCLDEMLRTLDMSTLAQVIRMFELLAGNGWTIITTSTELGSGLLKTIADKGAGWDLKVFGK